MITYDYIMLSCCHCIKYDYTTIQNNIIQLNTSYD